MFREQKGDECGWSRIRKQESGAGRGWGEAGARDVNLLASIPGGFNACHSSGTTNF